MTRVKTGDRVAGIFYPGWIDGEVTPEKLQAPSLGGSGADGTLAKPVAFDEGEVVKVPEHLSDEEAATLPLAGVTAWHAIIRRSGVNCSPVSRSVFTTSTNVTTNHSTENDAHGGTFRETAVRKNDSRFALLLPHGGAIETKTSDQFSPFVATLEEQLLGTLVEPTRKEAGCIRYDLMRGIPGESTRSAELKVFSRQRRGAIRAVEGCEAGLLRSRGRDASGAAPSRWSGQLRKGQRSRQSSPLEPASCGHERESGGSGR